MSVSPLLIDIKFSSARKFEVLTPENLHEIKDWMPRTCAYRLLAEGKDLPAWHPLVSGDPDSVVAAGQRVCNRTICEDSADELENHLIDWVE